jgi:phosphate transport system substrate-binding protein
LDGAGATFPMPIYQKWFADYQKSHGVRINYNGLGSAAGINKVTDGTVDFGASDNAMKDEQIAKIAKGVQLVPATAGAVVVGYNLPELKEPLKLSREALAGIFLGKISKWNDPAIAKENPGVPGAAIGVIHRAEGSGTTFVFTSHLAAISDEWKKSPGANATVKWPTGVGAKGNDGVTAQIKQTPGAIGYIEYSYAKTNGVTAAHLQNKAGKFVEAGEKSGQAGLATIKWDDQLRGWNPDPEGDDSYPIVTYTWLILYRDYGDANKAKAIRELVKYCLTDGQKDADALGYLAMPPSAVERAMKALDNVKP